MLNKTMESLEGMYGRSTVVALTVKFDRPDAKKTLLIYDRDNRQQLSSYGRNSGFIQEGHAAPTRPAGSPVSSWCPGLLRAICI
ncbi:hypothetical protein PAAG_12469 [Paracoccidioides lutzii Pb01]|uniref:Uncharacterized protein n=1 Tax=Paracoccidioides lutzii (strain ATCC MYA-826 / Pb01) TaxID=502779 RepID=A0A0A2V3Z3_PARBA|nr:hypothetical protein PAAG_12469 [Paracoccidioides lutzii Pb01]KGQ00880.1 hypothetical protein PAAG_12469 [Paracoccidioides lutzii Pb01]